VYELNNQLIEEYYIMTKRREYMQLNLGDDESFEDSEDYFENRKNNQNKHESSQHSIEVTNVDINLITNDKRLHVGIPNYENHYR
jgi:hypothetical protein